MPDTSSPQPYATSDLSNRHTESPLRIHGRKQRRPFTFFSVNLPTDTVFHNQTATCMFSRLNIKNYRGIRSAEIDHLSQINLFFGKNNCGKSSVLEAIFLLTGQSNPLLPVMANNMRGLMQSNENSLTTNFYGADTGNRIAIAAEGDTARELHIEMVRSNSGNIPFETLKSGHSDIANHHYGLRLAYHLAGDPTPYHSELIISNASPANGKANMDKRYHEPLFSQFIPAAYPHIDLSEKIANIFKNKQEAEILKALRLIEPRLKDLQAVGPNLMVDLGLSQRLPVQVLGDGTRKILSLIVAIYECAGGVLIVDEIDNGLHHSAMLPLWQSIFKTARRNRTQIFMSTHNADLLKGLVTTLENTPADRSLVSAYKLIRRENDEIVALHYDYDHLNYSIMQEIEMR